MKTALQSLKDYEDVIYNNEEEFLKEFCVSDAYCLNNVYFTHSTLKVYYELAGDQTVTQTIDIAKVIEWIENHES